MLLAHDPQVDPARAMVTDVGLVSTRTVALGTVSALGLSMTPDDLLRTVKVEPGTSDLLVLRMAASIVPAYFVRLCCELTVAQRE